MALSSALRGVGTFCIVFLVQVLLRSQLNWPPNSLVEYALSNPATALFDWHRDGYLPYLTQGLLGWGAAGAAAGLAMATLPRFRVMPSWKKIAVLAVAACAVLLLSATLWPMEGNATL